MYKHPSKWIYLSYVCDARFARNVSFVCVCVYVYTCIIYIHL